ncbi:MAG TPA: hypothetical protein VGX25_33135 [Actinophytocola sp.]|uniref:hypothetical protein n=1 Tax=Actinophytocola sp. TaxID=1872138 RepID=UPI002DDD921B|nr:hypothetical protein [Actinophytocola sp.]HEV2784256.1 hypothetical protein [Actinophytocola sp.]
MARYRPEERPAWLREGVTFEAEPRAYDPDDPKTLPYDPYAPLAYTMACTVAGRDGVYLIAWRARNRVDAEATFQEWLNKGWAIMSRTFWGEPCRYVFRTAAITGFVALPDNLS